MFPADRLQFVTQFYFYRPATQTLGRYWSQILDVIKIMHLKFYLFLLLLFVGCVSEKKEDVPEHLESIENLTLYPGDLDPIVEIELEREITFTDTDEVFFGRLVENIAVDDSGKVFIADMEESTIHVFDSDGSYLQNLGRRGQGPGEFEILRDFVISEGEIHVLDDRNFKISVFDLNTSDYIREHDVSLNNRQDNQPLWLNWTREERLFYRPSKIFVRADGKYILLFSDEGVGAVDNVNGRTYEVSIYDPKSDEFQQHDILSFEWTGQVLIHEIGDGFMTIFGVPYRRNSLFDYSDGQFVLGWTEEMLFRFYDANGQYQKAFHYTYSNTNYI